MIENTTGDQVSSPPSPANEAEEREERAKRLLTVQKVIARTAEAAERLEQIARVAKTELGLFIAQHPLGEITDNFLRIKETFERLEKADKDLQAVWSYSKEVSMPERLDREEITTFNTEDARVTRTVRVFASMVNDEATGYEPSLDWLRANGLESLIKPTVNSSSLSGAAKALLEEGKEMPEDLFRVHMKDGISLTRKKKA